MFSEQYVRIDMSIPEFQKWYKKLALFFRDKCAKRGYTWPHSGDVPAVSRYPNILMELRCYFLSPSVLARSAGVQLRTIVGAVEKGNRLTPAQLGKLARALNVEVEYLADPCVALVDAETSIGARQYARWGALLEATKGLCVPDREWMQDNYDKRYEGCLPYARYRYFIRILQSALRHPLPYTEPCGKVLYIDERMAL